MTFEEVFDDDFRAGRAETMIDEDVIQGVDGGFDIHGDGDALARGEAVGLDDDRRAVLLDVGLGRFEFLEGAVLGGGDVVACHELLGEVLGAFDLGGGLVRAERLDAGGFEIVDDAFDQRHFRSDEHPVVLVAAHEFDERGVVRQAALRGADAIELHAGIAGGDGHLVDAAAAHERVGDGVLTRAGTDDQNLLTHNLVSSTLLEICENCRIA